MAKYLYGASVQGIQSFIFQTNELKDIVGASELINNICDDAFDEFGGTKEQSVIRAAGNIKHIFNDEGDCKNAVKEFPRRVMDLAPGITISQAVVRFDEGQGFSDVIDELENRIKVQRNKQAVSNLGFIGMQRARSTGLPLVKVDKGDYLDLSTKAKREIANSGNSNSTKKLCKDCFGVDLPHSKIAYNIEDITKHNDWIAIIHADGNGLGKVIQEIGKNEKGYSTFSRSLNEATINAAQVAYKAICEKYEIDKEEKIPIRPIVLGGDDFTAICRADFAVDYTKEFLKAFEENTSSYLGNILKNNKVFKNSETKLTACAGISFIKSSFPFYFGYDLAEDLCNSAKKVAKAGITENELPKSCLMFHKVQDSFVVDYEEIAKRELNPQEKISFSFGPYFLDNRVYPSIDELQIKSKMLSTKEGNAVKSNIRQWMSLLYDKSDAAKQKMNRLKSMLRLSESKESKELLELVNWIENGKEQNGTTTYPAYDLLSIHSVTLQKTKNTNKED